MAEGYSLIALKEIGTLLMKIRESAIKDNFVMKAKTTQY
jgi:hypothetical protein